MSRKKIISLIHSSARSTRLLGWVFFFAFFLLGDYKGGVPLFAASPLPSSQELFDVACDLLRPYREREAAGRRLLARGAEVLPILLEGTKDSRSIRRQVAAILLGEGGDLRAEKALLTLAAGEDPLARSHATAALQKIYGKIKDADRLRRLQGILPDGIPSSPPYLPRMQEAALRASEEKGRKGEGSFPPEVIEEATRLLTHSDRDLRLAAIACLGSTHSPSLAPLLIALLKDESDTRIRQALCRAIAELRPAEGGEIFESLAQGEDRDLALEAIYVLHAMGYPQASRNLERFLQDEEPARRCRAIEMLGTIRDSFALAALLQATQDPYERVRIAALDALLLHAHPASIETAQALLRDEHPSIRVRAAILLAKLQVTGATWTLLEDLRKGDLPSRLEAAWALGEIRERRALAALGEALQEEDLEFVARAAKALTRIGDPQAKPYLLRALRDPRPAVSTLARFALATLFEEDPGEDPSGWPSFEARLEGR